MDQIVRRIVRWHETTTGARAAADDESYQRVHDRLRAIEEDRAHTPPGLPLFQREDHLQGDRGTRAAGRFVLRNRGPSTMHLSVTQVAGQLDAVVSHPGEIEGRGSAECRVAIDLSRVLSPGLHELALDVQDGEQFRLRVWVSVEVV